MANTRGSVHTIHSTQEIISCSRSSFTVFEEETISYNVSVYYLTVSDKLKNSLFSVRSIKNNLNVSHDDNRNVLATKLL